MEGLKFAKIYIIVLFLGNLLLITACSNTKEQISYTSDPEMKATLKVMTIESEDQFMAEVGDFFKAKYPNIEISVINYFGDNLEKAMNEEKPDVVIHSVQDYEQLIQQDKLYDLSNLLSNDKFNLDGVHQEFVDYLRLIGGGKLYGLPPEFQTKAIYYNKDLFDKYKIPYPQDRMTWEEMIQLAKRFPSGDGVSGLYMLNFSAFVDDMAWSRDVSMINIKDMKLTINSASYKKIFETIVDAYMSKTVVIPEMDQFEVYDPFISGTSAMTVDYYYYINNKINWAKAEKGDKFQLNWDVVSAPVDEKSRDTSPYYYFGGITSINVDSEQKQAAWELIKFVNGEEFAKMKSKTSGFVPSTRTDFIYNPEGKRMEAFYVLKPRDKWMPYEYYSAPPKGFFAGMEGIINSELKAVTAGAKTLDEAMASMEERGQRLLDKK